MLSAEMRSIESAIAALARFEREARSVLGVLPRHMRMYIGKGEYRDNSRHRRHGGPVWGSSPISLYVVLGVWDPFGKIRPFL